MARYRMVCTEFWKNPIVLENMTPEDKYFYLYLLTNLHTTQIGIYKITKKQMAFDLGYSIEAVQSIMERFQDHHKMIRYNQETRELAIKNWGKDILLKGGKPVIDCMISELEEVEDCSLIQYVAESIAKSDIRSLYESFYKNTYITVDDTLTQRLAIRGQKEEEKEEEKQQEVFEETIVQRTEEVKEIVAFWDHNGFGFTNINAKEQLLSWLEDSSFPHPKTMILKAMNIACANNKRQLNYIVGILKNWQNQSLLSVEDVDANEADKMPVSSKRLSSESPPAGRPTPREFKLDITAGEE